MELFRRTEGHWPTQLDQATEEPPVDPWSGKPMKIAFDDGQPLIYSIGVDRNDDNGAYYNKEWDLDKDWEPADSKHIPDWDWILWPLIVDKQWFSLFIENSEVIC